MLENPTRDRRAERREATKAEILDAAWEIVRTEGLAGLTLRDVAKKVGMQAPSLYQYFDSKHAIYDAMFAQGNQALLDRFADVKPTGDPMADMRRSARTFVEFSAEDAARYQLLFQRTIPGFEPSQESYALALQVLEGGRARLTAAGFEGQRALDLWTSVVAGLAAQQTANEPGGTRWVRLVDEAVDMYVQHMRTRARSRK
jgi:AcrR family transcriptional regulator